MGSSTLFFKQDTTKYFRKIIETLARHSDKHFTRISSKNISVTLIDLPLTDLC